ncbi:MAG: type II toxin-antitoxin system RelE/ParE family toxin [Eubacterium sp.]|nr:type II toxin-antitoxin system RelE/ParE family toxin [Eubacterium sp.]
MIKSFAHKGLKDFYETGSKKGIQPDHAPKLARMTFYFEGQDAFLVDYMDYH